MFIWLVLKYYARKFHTTTYGICTFAHSHGFAPERRGNSS